MEINNVVRLAQPGEFDDALTSVLRVGARELLTQAVEAEVETFRARYAGLRLEDGRGRLVRHGFGPERSIQTGIGPVSVPPSCARSPHGWGPDAVASTGKRPQLLFV